MAGNRSVKDKQMAARLKKDGVTRTGANCPMCHHHQSLNGLPNHIRMCGGRTRLPRVREKAA